MTIEPLDERPVSFKTFRPGEFETVLKHLTLHLQQFFAFQCGVGWRISEVLTLEWRMIQFDEELIVLPAHSTKEDDDYERVHPFTDELRDILWERKAERGRHGKMSPYVFTDENGNRLFDYGNGRPKAKREVYAAWHSACEQAQLLGRLPHGLRGTGAINRRNAGIADDLNMALGGWRTRAMLDRYLGKKRKEDLRNATAKLDAFKMNRRQTVGE